MDLSFTNLPTKMGYSTEKISFFFVDGTLFQEFEFNKGMANGLHKIYDKNGNLILETHHKNNIKNGIRTYYIPRRDEQISLSGNYENGAIIGDLTYKISDYHYYILPNDLEKGTFKEYYQNKLKRQYSTKTNNTIDGDFLEYYPETETLSAKIPYKFGVVDGICDFYDTKGNLYNKLEYKNGRKIGTHKNISEKGRLYAEEYYDNEGKISASSSTRRMRSFMPGSSVRNFVPGLGYVDSAVRSASTLTSERTSEPTYERDAGSATCHPRFTIVTRR